jgi:hypothetical protein
MNPTRTFSILLAALSLVSGTPLLVVAAQKPTEVAKIQGTGKLPVDSEAHHHLGLQF